MCRKGWEKGGRLSKVSYPKSFGGNKVDNKAKRNELKLLKLLLLPQPVQNLWFRALSVLVCTSVPTQAHLGMTRKPVSSSLSGLRRTIHGVDCPLSPSVLDPPSAERLVNGARVLVGCWVKSRVARLARREPDTANPNLRLETLA